MVMNDCISGTITPYVPSEDMPWNKVRAMHLFRRMGFGATPTEIEAALAQSPTDLVDQIIDEAINLPLPEEPVWANWEQGDYEDFNMQRDEQILEWLRKWIRDMHQFGFREKLALFWSNHFVTKFETYQCPSYMYGYHKMLQQFALGNFKTFITEIGRTPAMLIFLNGIQNTRLDPNENYARELYELFSLGRDNGYTQNDIEETARALTGYNGFVTLCAPIGYLDVAHDPGVKTIFGQTGNWDYDDVHNILFEQRGDLIATYICTKIYEHFVSTKIDDGIVAELAATFQANNFELAPVFRQLFKSEHFFDEAVIGVQIKSPVEFFLTLMKEGDLGFPAELEEPIIFFSNVLGQLLLSPPDVSGWPGDRSWISNNTITARWQGAQYYLVFLYENLPEVLRTMAKTLSENSNSPEYITQVIVDHFIPNGLSSLEEYDQATVALKGEIPQNYFDEMQWNLDWDTAPGQVALLLFHITSLPEFQLI